jgi:tetratricopeptide (TPR) repeat protein
VVAAWAVRKMKCTARVGLGRGGLLLGAVLVLASCGRGDPELLQPLIDLDATRYRGQEITAARVAELRAAIDRYQKDIERIVRERGELAVFHKALAVSYMDRGMYGLAALELTAATAIDAENPVLFYLLGVASAQQALASIDTPAHQELNAAAERSYQRAIDLDPTYVDALYGLAVLLLYELERPADAEPYVDRVLRAEPRNIDAMFVRAAALAASGRPERAIEQYQAIVAASTVEERREQARLNSRELESRR